MRFSKVILICFAMLFCLHVQAKRVALVIGNDNYLSVSKLQKAGNDANAMARELRNAGFAVQLHQNLNYRATVRAVESFTQGIQGGDEAVVFYAGHGVQIRNGSYLLPTDIEANSESEVEKTAYELLALTDKISEAKPAFSLVMVDACRDNPLKSKGRNIGNARGLSAIEPPKGQMVVYSASRGQQALDRLSDKDPNPNGVFTREFITQMKKPGVRIEDIMRSVQDSVEMLAKSVSHEQRPAVYNEARGNFYFFGPTAVQVAPSVAAELTASQREDGFWSDAKATGNKEAYEAYLESYPTGRYVNLAKANIARLTPPTIVAAVPSPASIAVQTAPQISNLQSAGAMIKDCAGCPEMLPIPPGSFDMGSNEDGDSRPVHRVTVQGFFMGKTEVTLEQWKAVMGYTPRYPSKCLENCPIAVSWNDALLFTKQLSEKTGKQYRLPSEAEWEYAARASSRTKWSFGDNENSIQDFAWFGGNNNKMESPVALKRPNLFGLFDMHGNLWEWTQDCWNNNYTGAPTDGSVWATGDCSRRVVRGGSWQSSKHDLRSAYRNTFTSSSSVTNGFRVVRASNVILPAPIAQPFLSPRDVLAGAYVGTWSPEQCGSKTTYVNRLENESLLGEFRGNGNLISTSVIRLDTVKYLGSFNGMHRVAYRVTSENASNKVQTVNDLTIETDFKIRRTVDSTRGNVQLIKDGVLLSSNQKVVDIVKCN